MDTPIDLIILAGGGGHRMGGIDKGLMPVGGKPAVRHLCDNLLHEGDHLIVSANRHQESYEALGATVVTDRHADQGPLAGILAAIDACRHDNQLIVPCDMPWLPRALRAALLPAAVPDAVNVLHDGTQLQPLVLGMKARQWQQSLSAYLDSGQRSAHSWLDGIQTRTCTVESHHEHAFRNLNAPSDIPS